MSSPDCSSVTDKLLTRRRSPALVSAITICSLMVLSTTTSAACQPRAVFCVSRSTPIWSWPSLSGSASSDVIPSSTRTSRTSCNSGAAGASGRVSVPWLMAASCTTVTSLLRAFASPAFTPSPWYSLTALGTIPGLRAATMQRLIFHCAPISATAVDITASALVWR